VYSPELLPDCQYLGARASDRSVSVARELRRLGQSTADSDDDRDALLKLY